MKYNENLLLLLMLSMCLLVFCILTCCISRLFCPKSQIIWELKIAQYKMYTKILAQGAKFGSGATFWTTLDSTLYITKLTYINFYTTKHISLTYFSIALSMLVSV